MKVIFGGARGSGPVSGPRFSEYGSDTTSLLVCGDQAERLILDAGTGLRHLLPHLGGPDQPLALLMTHFHLDHLMGLPAFTPLYQSGRLLTIAGPTSGAGKPGTREILGTILADPFWPVSLDQMESDRTTLDVSVRDGTWLDDPDRDCLFFGNLEIRACPLAHPGGCVAWRIDEPATGSSMVLATDVEWGLADEKERALFLDFCRQPSSLSLLVMDGHFNAAEYALFSGWGHSTWEEVAEVGMAVGAEKIAVTHHAPRNEDHNLNERAHLMAEFISEHGGKNQVFFARQGQEVSLIGATG